jgi:hypothetical protein
VAIYILICVIVSISATIFLPDYTNRDISQEEVYGAQEAGRVPAQAEAYDFAHDPSQGAK